MSALKRDPRLTAGDWISPTEEIFFRLNRATLSLNQLDQHERARILGYACQPSYALHAPINKRVYYLTGLQVVPDKTYSQVVTAPFRISMVSRSSPSQQPRSRERHVMNRSAFGIDMMDEYRLLWPRMQRVTSVRVCVSRLTRRNLCFAHWSHSR